MKLEQFPPNRGKRRKPLRTTTELAAELGVTMAQLRGYLGAENAPTPELTFDNKSYYEPVAFRRWFATVRRTH